MEIIDISEVLNLTFHKTDCLEEIDTCSVLLVALNKKC